MFVWESISVKTGSATWEFLLGQAEADRVGGSVSIVRTEGSSSVKRRVKQERMRYEKTIVLEFGEQMSVRERSVGMCRLGRMGWGELSQLESKRRRRGAIEAGSLGYIIYSVGIVSFFHQSSSCWYSSHYRKMGDGYGTSLTKRLSNCNSQVCHPTHAALTVSPCWSLDP